MLITVGWGIALRRWQQKWHRQQQAWQWWHQHQAIQSHHTAESIRDGLLQQTFAFRRYLEIADQSTDSLNLQQTRRWLERFQTFYQSLETLSDELSPPFIADSLPLALKFTITGWQSSPAQSETAPAIHFDLPTDWLPSSAHQNQAVLSVVTALLTLLLPKGQIKSHGKGHSANQLNVALSQAGTDNILTLKIASEPTSATSKITELEEFQHLKEIFHSLTAGRLEISQVGGVLTSHLRWQNDMNP